MCSSCKGCTVATDPVEAMPSQKAEVDPAIIIVSILFHNCLENISASQQEVLRGKTVTERALVNGSLRHLQGRWRQKKKQIGTIYYMPIWNICISFYRNDFRSLLRELRSLSVS